jgi:hypothetical protein
MKVVEKIKKGLIGIGLFLYTISTKVFAVIVTQEYLSAETEYGVRRVSKAEIIWIIARNFIIPIVLLIGIIMYFKKSKSSIKKKILVTIGIIAITAILYFVINKIIYKLA